MLGVDINTPLTDEQREAMLDSVARKIVSKGMETPAVLFLEMHKPLSFIAGQTLLVGLPILGAVFGAQDVADFSKVLQDRENVDRLICRIEEMIADTPAKEATAKYQE